MKIAKLIYIFLLFVVVATANTQEAEPEKEDKGIKENHLLPEALNRNSNKKMAYLGIITSYIDSDLATYLKLPENLGVLVDFIQKNSAAMGKLERYDIILSIDDQFVTSPFHTKQVIQRYNPGEQATFNIIRKGKKLVVDITFGGIKADPKRIKQKNRITPFPLPSKEKKSTNNQFYYFDKRFLISMSKNADNHIEYIVRDKVSRSRKEQLKGILRDESDLDKISEEYQDSLRLAWKNFNKYNLKLTYKPMRNIKINPRAFHRNLKQHLSRQFTNALRELIKTKQLTLDEYKTIVEIASSENRLENPHSEKTKAGIRDLRNNIKLFNKLGEQKRVYEFISAGTKDQESVKEKRGTIEKEYKSLLIIIKTNINDILKSIEAEKATETIKSTQ